MTWQKISRFTSDNYLKDAVLIVCSASWFVKRYDMGNRGKEIASYSIRPTIKHGEHQKLHRNCRPPHGYSLCIM